jgi:S1-C subfamily serine protease
MKTKEIIKKNRKAIVLLSITIPTVNNQQSISIRGTGFIISKEGKFITNYHVYKEIPEGERNFLSVKVIDKDDNKGITYYREYKVKLIDKDEENDIALMQIVETDGNIFETIEGFGNSEDVEEGEEMLFVGYPLATELLSMGFGITMSSNSCIVSSVKKRGVDGSLHLFIIDTHVNNGSSGSPIFLKDSGKVVGVVSGKISQKIPLPDGKVIDIPANIGICIPSKYIENIIKK